MKLLRLVVVPAALMLGAAPALAQRWRPGDRVVITDFSHVTAVAAGRSMVYAVTTGGVISFDRRFNRWEQPMTHIDGMPDVAVSAALVDPADESLWLATENGVVHFQPQLRQVDVVQLGPVSDIMFDRDDPIQGLFVYMRGAWELLPRGGLLTMPGMSLPPVARRVRRQTLDDVLQRYAQVQAMAPTTLLDRRMRRYAFTAAAGVTGESEAYFGTDGLGLYRYDGLSARLESLSFGLRHASIGTAVPVPGGVWIGTNGDANTPSIFARVAEDLSIRYEEGSATSPRFQEVRDMLVRGFDLFAATEHGLIRFEMGGAWRTIDVTNGLPGDRTFALANGSAGTWVGTDKGLGIFREPPVATVGALGQAIYAVAPFRDSAWVGTSRGLRLAVAGQNELVIPDDVSAEPALSRPVVSVSRLIDTTVAATSDRIAWKGGRGTWVVERPLPELGEIRTVTMDRGGAWIGGTRGFGFFAFEGHSFQGFTMPEDTPGPVNRIVPSGSFVWLATDGGLVRYVRRALEQ